MQVNSEDAAVLRVVGMERFRKAVPYARNGAVTNLKVTNDGSTISGHVAGGHRYTTTVHLTHDSAGRLVEFLGMCTCPVGDDCKHSVALILAAQERPGAAVTPLRPTWQSGLDALLRSVTPDPEASHGSHPAGVALQFETSSTGPVRSIGIRPVVPGRNGAWVRSGISWNNLHALRYGLKPADLTHARLLTELLALYNAGANNGYGYYSTSRALLLEEFGSRRLWDVLREAREQGLPFVGTRASDGPVVVHDSAANTSLDLRAVDDGLVAAPRIELAGTDVPLDSVCLLGSPPHGIGWAEPHGAGSSLHLAPLADPDLDLGRLLTLEPAHVPARDVGEFLRDYAVPLRNAVPVASSDSSVELPDLGAPELVLQLRHDPGRLGVHWTWRYASGGLVVPLDDVDTGSRLRDRPAERALADAAAGACAGLPAVREGGALRPWALLTGHDFLRFPGEVLPRIESLDGVVIELIGPELTYRESTDEPSIEFVADDDPGSRDWLDLSVSVQVDGEQVPFVDLFRALAQGAEVMVLPSGTWFRLDRPEFEQLAALIAESHQLYEAEPGTVRVSRYQAGMWDDLETVGEVVGDVTGWRDSVRSLLTAGSEAAVSVPLPSGFTATLRPYQDLGYAWLVRLYEHGLGGVLADEMGLGKTVQCLALCAHIREKFADAPPFLVVAPTSVVSNWAAECARFAPDLRVATVSESAARRRVPIAEIAAGADVVVTSYALFRIDSAEYADVAWAGLVLDEAQFIKNHRSKAFACARALPTPFKLAITGTPMENHLAELWAMFAVAAPGLFPTLQRFEEYYRTPIERGRDSARLDQLRRRIRPFMLRRTKREVIDDLPPKLEQVLELDLDPRHRKAYQTLLARERRKVLGLLSDLDRNQFEILRSLTLLRQASLDVSLVDPTKSGVPSTKLVELMSMLTEIADDGHRVIVFSQFTRFLERVRTELATAGIAHNYLDGRTRHRAAVIDDFKNGDSPVFLISIKAGGFGLNLTEADYCIVLDPWWNPAVEAQAVDRVHRIGQKRTVTVYRLVARDTIEQKVMALKQAKAALFASVMDDGDWSGARLTADEIRDLLD